VKKISIPNSATAALLLSTLTGWAWTLYAGKDLNWDFFNYHLYSGYSALNYRFDKDFFTANLQGYLNPYSHVPLYLMVHNDWPPTIIALALSTLQTTNALIIYKITIEALPESDEYKKSLALLSCLICLTSPILLQEIGSSFNEATTSIPVLLSIYFIIKRKKTTKSFFIAGTLIGVAIALKMTNLMFFASAFPVLALQKYRLKRISLYILGTSISFLIINGHWSYQLYKHMGNPFFPMFNEFFKAENFTTEPIKHFRFSVNSVVDYLLRAFEIATPKPYTWTETTAPDLKFLIIFIAGPLLILTQKFSHPIKQLSLLNSSRSHIILYLFSSWIIWMTLSGNGRYYLPMICLSSSIIIIIIQSSLNKKPFLTHSLAIIIATCQIYIIATSADKRWSAYEWKEKWVTLDIPNELRSKPWIFLTTELQSSSFILPYLSEKSSMINISGQYGLTSNSEDTRQKAIINQNTERLRSLNSQIASAPTNIQESFLKAQFIRFNLTPDMSDCMTIVFEETPKGNNLSSTNYLSCKLKKAPIDAYESYKIRIKEIDAAFNSIEDTCPNLFQPPRMPTISSFGNGPVDYRYYINTDIQLYLTSKGEIKYYNTIKQGDPITIDTLENYKKKKATIECDKNYSPPFGGKFSEW